MENAFSAPPQPFPVERPVPVKPPPIPKPVPAAPPAPQPQPSPANILPPLAIGLALRSVMTCDLDDTARAWKSRDTGPRTGAKKKPQSRPCGGAKPEVTYRKRRRLVGVLFTSNRVGAKIPKRISQHPKFKKWKRKKYPDDSGYRVILEIELTDVVKYNEAAQRVPNNLRDRIGLGGNPIEGCHYLIYEVGKRRICRCPDGSKCRR